MRRPCWVEDFSPFSEGDRNSPDRRKRYVNLRLGPSYRLQRTAPGRINAENHPGRDERRKVANLKDFVSCPPGFRTKLPELYQEGLLLFMFHGIRSGGTSWPACYHPPRCQAEGWLLPWRENLWKHIEEFYLWKLWITFSPNLAALILWFVDIQCSSSPIGQLR